jgi:Transmembrane amino acid transporter protein
MTACPAMDWRIPRTAPKTSLETSETLPLESSGINWRATTWLTTFYLLTTDVLGPSGAPWSVSKFGYVPGAILFISMGGFAAYSSILLWQMFLRLDSVERPIRTWRDIGDRLCGVWFGHLITIMQSTQMFLGVCYRSVGECSELEPDYSF